MKNFLSILLAGTLIFSAALFASCNKEPEIANEYSIMVTVGPGGSVETIVGDAIASKALEGDEVTLTAIPDEGYQFRRWTVESGDMQLSGNPATFTMPGSDVSVKVEFIENDAPMYTITVSTDGNGTAVATIDGDPVTEAYADDIITVTATPGTDYEFGRWVVEDGVMDLTGNPATFAMPAGNLSLKAIFNEGEINIFDKIIDPQFLYFCQLMGYDTNKDGVFSLAEAKVITKLEGPPQFFCQSLAGIEYFTELVMLTLNDNYALTYVDLSKNTKLIHLSLYSNLLAEIDLSNNKELRHLHVGTNFITQLDLSNNTKIVQLYINRNPITDIDVSMLPDLQLLYYHDCYELTSLDLSHNPKLIDVQGAFAWKLASLNLSNLSALKSLDCYGSPLSTLDLSDCESLENLVCVKNNLTSLDLSSCSNLKELNCYDNKITSLDLSFTPELETVSCARNRMTELNITNMPLETSSWTGYYYASCGQQTTDGTTPQTLTLTMRDEQKPWWYTYPATHADNSNVVIAGDDNNILSRIADPILRTYCEQFDTDGDGILTEEEAGRVTEISVSKMGIASMVGIANFPALTTLICDGNLLTGPLDLSQNTVLTTVRCQENKLTDIKLVMLSAGEGCTALESIWCYSNELTTFTAAHSTALKDLVIFNNRISRLNLVEMTDPTGYTLICGKQRTYEGEEGETIKINLRSDQSARWEELKHSANNINVEVIYNE